MNASSRFGGRPGLLAPRLSIGVALALLLGCSSTEAPTQVPPLPPGALLRVGSRVVDVELLEALQGPRQAAPAALERDFLLAQGLDETVQGRRGSIERGMLGRALLEDLGRVADAQGPIQPSEWDAALGQLWLELDRPRAVRTVDVFLPVLEFTPDGPAFELAEKVHAALEKLPVTGPGAPAPIEEFVRLAQSAGADNSTLVQRPPMTVDGRAVPVGALDAKFAPLQLEVAQGAARLTHVGELSPVLGGRDGFHILLCTEIIDALKLPEAEQKARVAPFVRASRSAAELESLKQTLRARTPVVVAPQQQTLTRLVWREP